MGNKLEPFSGKLGYATCGRPDHFLDKNAIVVGKKIFSYLSVL